MEVISQVRVGDYSIEVGKHPDNAETPWLRIRVADPFNELYDRYIVLEGAQLAALRAQVNKVVPEKKEKKSAA